MSYELTVAELAEGQAGMFTAAQAASAGVPRQALSRLRRRQLVERVAHGVYRLTGTPPDPVDELRAAWLGTSHSTESARRTDEPVVVSHRSAAWLHQLGDLDADRHEFTTSQRRQSRRGDIRFHRGALPATDITTVDGLPVTTVERTVEDLGRTHTDGEHLARVVRDAVASAHIAPAALADRLRPFAHFYGHRVGDSDGLVSELLAQAGMPRAITDAATYAGLRDFEAFARQTLALPAARHAPSRSLLPQVELPRTLELPTLRLLEDLDDLPPGRLREMESTIVKQLAVAEDDGKELLTYLERLVRAVLDAHNEVRR